MATKSHAPIGFPTVGNPGFLDVVGTIWMASAAVDQDLA